MTKQSLPYVSDKHGNYTFNSSVNKDVLISLALELIEDEIKGEALTSAIKTKDYLRLKIGAFEHKVFSILFLDSQHRIIEFEEISRGTIDGASVYPGEVVKTVLKHNAAAVIFSHNHPSGHAEPSQADRNITQKLKNALSLIDVRVLDHIIVSKNETVSFSERGLI